jgi:hypothetical protein
MVNQPAHPLGHRSCVVRSLLLRISAHRFRIRVLKLNILAAEDSIQLARGAKPRPSTALAGLVTGGVADGQILAGSGGSVARQHW